MLVDDSYQTNVIDIQTNLSSPIEAIFVQVTTTSGQPLIIGAIYIPPNSDPNAFNIDLDNILASINNTNKSGYICGDFNLNLFNVDTHPKTTEFLNIMSTHSYRPLIEVPTRITISQEILADISQIWE